ALDDVELDLTGQPLLLELAGNQAGGEGRRVERTLELVGEIGKRADMVFVPVGEDDPGQPLLLFLDEFEVGKDEVDSGIRRVGKGQAEVNHDPLPTAAVEIDVHADLSRTAKGAKQELFARDHFAFWIAIVCNRLNPWMVRSGSIASNTLVCLSNRSARPTVAITVSGPSISRRMRSTSPSIM